MPSSEFDFKFDRYGVRVPAVFVSPFIEESTVIRAAGNTPFDHTSLIRTICEKWGVGSLTDRDRAAPSIAPLLPRAAPRGDLPIVTARPYQKAATDISRTVPISQHQQHVLGLISNALNVEVPSDIKHVGDAIDHIANALKRGWQELI
jgi:phospholipase C